MRYVLLLALFYFQSLSADLNVRIKAPAAIVINAETGKILYAKRAHTRIYPASTMKVATALFTLNALKQKDLNSYVTVPKQALTCVTAQYKYAKNFELPAYWNEPDGSSINLKLNEKLTVNDLLHAMLISSCNQSANTLAMFVAGDIAHFCDRMTIFCKSLGCLNTQFLNPHGLYHPENYSTPYDMALIARQALKNKYIRSMTSMIEYEIPQTNKSAARVIKQTNLLLRPTKSFYYPKAFGLKTGYTKVSGYNIIATASDGDRTLIAAIYKNDMRSQTFRDAINLFDEAFKEKKTSRLLFNKSDNTYYLNVEGGKSRLEAQLMEDVFMDYYPSEEPEYEYDVTWKKLKAPIQIGQIVADVHITDKEKTFEKIVHLYATHHVPEKMSAIFLRNFKILLGSKYFWSTLFIVGLVAYCGHMARRFFF